MKLPIAIAEKLILLLNGEKKPFSKLKHSVINAMIDNGVLEKQIQGRSKNFIYLTDKDSLDSYIKNHFGIDNIRQYIESYKNDNLSRAEAIDISSNSKLKTIRTFQGFLVNCYVPIECFINGEPFIVAPQKGTFTFIYDYESFIPSKNVIIVGIENPENFRHIEKQRKLFNNIQALFVSRYPQNKDLIRWLQMIPNKYLHFGDFDFAGLNIYWNEYKRKLHNRAEFYLPINIEDLIFKKGNRDLYNKQTIQFDENKINEKNILILLGYIKKYKKGLEQEILII
jgi:hypothetical protein